MAYKDKNATYMCDVIAVGPSTETSSGKGIVLELRDPYHYAGFQRWFEVPEAIQTDVLTVAVEAIRGGKRLYTKINYEGEYKNIRNHPKPIEITFVCLKP